MKKLNKVFIVIRSDAPMYGDETWVAEVFDTEEKAQKYCDLYNEIESGNYSYYIDEKEVQTEIDMDSKVAEYYNYYVGKEILEFDELDYSDVQDYVTYNSYLTSEQVKTLVEKDKQDQSQNEYGNRSHKEAFNYLKEILPQDVINKVTEKFNEPDERWCNYEDEKEKRIYTKDLDIEETDDHIQVYSIDSFELAKTEALKLYENWKNNR